MADEKRLIAYNPITFESFTRHATKHIDQYYDPYGEGFTDAVDSIEGWLKNNTVDAVEVVRCKDCKYAENDGIHQVSLKCTRFKTGQYTHRMHQSDFCSYGEKRGDGDG